MVFYIFGRLKIFFSWSIFVYWKYYEDLSSGDILSWNFEFVLTRYGFSLVQWLNIFLLFLPLLFLEWNFSTCGRPKRTKTVDLPMWSNGRKFKLWQSMDRFGRLTKIIILGWTSGRIFDGGASTSWMDSDDGPKMSNVDDWIDGRKSICRCPICDI